jgi:putative CRISPR-associated protein (TIGR02619 family)
MRTILTTVGISLLQNAKRHHDLSRDESPSKQQLANYLRHGEAEEVSAETNALHRIGLQSNDRVVFLHSETQKSRKCAGFLSRHYTDAVDSVSARGVPDLSYEEKKFKDRGLRSLVDTLTKLIREAERGGREALINATGGFKAEIAYATLVGLLFDVPVYYIHERFGDIVEMPVLPIEWNYSLLHDHHDFFEWVFLENPPADEVNRRLKGRSDKLRSLLAEENGNVYLSPAGEAVYEAYLDEVEESPTDEVLLSSEARRVYESDPNTQEKLDRIFAKLQKRTLREEKSQAMKASSNAFLFPRGFRDERVVYVKGDGGREIYVCEAFVVRQKTELREVTAERVSLDDYTDFQPWNPPDA